MDRFDTGTGTDWCRTAGLQGGQGDGQAGEADHPVDHDLGLPGDGGQGLGRPAHGPVVTMVRREQRLSDPGQQPALEIAGVDVQVAVVALPEADVVPHPVAPNAVRLADWWRWPGTLALIANEYNKYLFALARYTLRG